MTLDEIQSSKELEERFLREATELRTLYTRNDFKLFLTYVTDQIELLKEALVLAKSEDVAGLQGQILGLRYCFNLQGNLENKLTQITDSSKEDSTEA